MRSSGLLLCFALAGSVVVLAQAQKTNMGFNSPHEMFDPNIRKSIVCNYRGVCHYLDHGQNSPQKVHQKKDLWKRILRSSEEEEPHPIDPMLTIRNHQFEIQKRTEETVQNEWARLKKFQISFADTAKATARF